MELILSNSSVSWKWCSAFIFIMIIVARNCSCIVFEIEISSSSIRLWISVSAKWNIQPISNWTIIENLTKFVKCFKCSVANYLYCASNNKISNIWTSSKSAVSNICYGVRNWNNCCICVANKSIFCNNFNWIFRIAVVFINPFFRNQSFESDSVNISKHCESV